MAGLDLWGAYQQFRTAQDETLERKKENALADLAVEKKFHTGQAMQGNTNSLKRLYTLDPEAGMNVKQFSDAEKKASVEKWGRLAFAANDPQSWAQLQARAQAEGHELGGFEERESILAEGMSLADQLGISFKERDFAADQAHRNAQLGIDRERFGLEREKMAQPDKPPTSIQEYEYAKGQGFTGTFSDYETAMKKAGASTVNVNGDQKLTEGQSKDLGFYSRGIYANKDLAKNEEALLSLTGNVAGNAGVVGNYFKDPKYRQAERAGREILAVILRKDTGAAVTEAEFELYGPMYLPWPGDDKQTIISKREARDRFLKGVRLGGGTARPLYDEIDREFNTPDPAAPAATEFQWTPDGGLQ